MHALNVMSLSGAVHQQNNYTFAIIGCGQMGVRIACELLRRGCRVFMWDNNAFRCQSVHVSVRSMLSSYRSIDAFAIDSLMKLLYIASAHYEFQKGGSRWEKEHGQGSVEVLPQRRDQSAAQP